MSMALTALAGFSLLIIMYMVLWNVSQIAMSPLAAVALWRHQRQYTRRARRLAGDVKAPPLVSIIVPAYNEELTIVESIRALLALDYEWRELVVINDGSTDGMLATLERTFGLVPAPLAFVQPLSTAMVRGVYRSISEPDLVVVDKENGGCKSDAVNAGINVASGTLVFVIDGDTLLEADALTRAVLPFLEDPLTVAVGGTVAIANGCQIEHGRIADVALPRSWLARFQIVEYMRSFLLFRLACASQNAVVLISGAFGLFRRDAVIAVGGFDRTAIGEDMDLTVRLQRYFRERREPFRIAFDPNPLCWTQAPEDWRSLQG
jgi:cellulose synthase/poly-beta-1,6-N-acetylglucosamine synthase-like glycosyltransferase